MSRHAHKRLGQRPYSAREHPTATERSSRKTIPSVCNVSLQRKKEKKEMTKTANKAPMYVRAANILTTTLLRVGVKLTGGGGKYSMYLLTARGRKSGLPRTVP